MACYMYMYMYYIENNTLLLSYPIPYQLKIQKSGPKGIILNKDLINRYRYMLILTWKVLATGKRPSRKKSTDARLCHLLHYSIPARLYFLTNVTRLIEYISINSLSEHLTACIFLSRSLTLITRVLK